MPKSDDEHLYNYIMENDWFTFGRFGDIIPSGAPEEAAERIHELLLENKRLKSQINLWQERAFEQAERRMHAEARIAQMSIIH